MKRITVLLMFGLLMIHAGAISQDKRPDAGVHDAASVLMENPARVGLSVGVLKDGKTYTYHYGTMVKGKGILPSDNTLYEIGSITKTITGTLLAFAVSENKVRLDDDVRKYLDGDYSNLAYEDHPIRLTHLLNHSSGLPYMLPDHPELFKNPNYDTLPFILSSLERDYSRPQFFEDLKRVKIDTIPGIKLKYSNAAAQLLGYILEQVYSKPFDELVDQYVADPLNMLNTGLTFPGGKMELLAKGYNAKGVLMPYNRSGAAGGIYSTIDDMLKYARFHLNEGNYVVKLTHTPTWGDIRYYAMGLNWQMQKNDEVYRIFQSGGTGGFSSYLAIYPDLNVAIVLLSNESDEHSQNALSQAAEKILQGIRSTSTR